MRVFKNKSDRNILIIIICFTFLSIFAYSEFWSECNLIETSKYYRNNLKNTRVITNNITQKNINTAQEEIFTEAIKTIEYIQPVIEYQEIPTCTNELVLYDIPSDINTEFKAFMDYNCITDTTTKQYELQQQAYTDEYGLRKIDEYYCVALGSYYTETIGDKFKITLDTDVEFNVIVGDLKQDCHTDVKNQYTPVYDNSGNFYGANIIEFIIDENAIHDMVYVFGTISYYDKFEGNITSIEKIEIINN